MKLIVTLLSLVTISVMAGPDQRGAVSTTPLGRSLLTNDTPSQVLSMLGVIGGGGGGSNNFDTGQFIINGAQVSIKSGALVTNLVINGEVVTNPTMQGLISVDVTVALTNGAGRTYNFLTTSNAWTVASLNDVSNIVAAAVSGGTPGSGTVTSVGITAPSTLFNSPIIGSPITSSGALTLSLANQNAHYIFLGPASGSPSAPSFRPMVNGDIPPGVLSGGLSNALIRTPISSGTHESSLVWNGTNNIPGGGKHISVTSGSAIATSSDGAFAGLLPGENIEFPDNPHQLVVIQVIDTNTAIVYQVETSFYDLVSTTRANSTSWDVHTRPVRFTDDIIGIEHYGGFFDCNGSLWMDAIGDQGTVNFLSTDGDGSMFSLGMTRGSIASLSAPTAFTISSGITNANNFAGTAVSASVVVSGYAPNLALVVGDDGRGSFRYGVNGQINALSNSFIRTPLAAGTHESSLVWNSTNTIPSGGTHITVTAGSAVATSSDGAFAGMFPGEGIEFSSGSPSQIMIAGVINTNSAMVYEVETTGFGLPSGNQTASTSWVCRPRPVRWTDDATGSEHLGGWFGPNGDLFMWGIGDQGSVNLVSTGGDGSIFTQGIRPGSDFGYSAPLAFVISSAITNASNTAGGSVQNIVTVSGYSKNEALDIDDKGVAHFQYGASGWHGQPLSLGSATNGISTVVSNSLALGVIGSSIAATNGGFNWTNISGVNITVFVDNSGVTASAFKINGTTVYTSANGNWSIPLQNQEWISFLYSGGTPTVKYKAF